MIAAGAIAGARTYSSLGTPTLAPTSDSEFGVDTFGNTFSPNNVVTPSGGSGNYSYTWSFNSEANGTWSLVSGQGTNSVQIRVLGVGTGVTATANLLCTITDNVTGLSINSANASYSYTNIHVP